MRPQLLMGAVGIFIVGTVLACIASGRWLLNGEMNIINALASFNNLEIDVIGVWSIPKSISTFWSAVATSLSWNYPFLAYDWAVFIKIPLWLVSIGVIWGFIQVAITVIQGMVSAVKGLL